LLISSQENPKFSASKIDMRLVQSVHLLEELNKETNNCGIKIPEWIGWYFHELLQPTTDNVLFCQTYSSNWKTRWVDQADLPDLLT
jgi:RNA processing factor Prp31